MTHAGSLSTGPSSALLPSVRHRFRSPAPERGSLSTHSLTLRPSHPSWQSQSCARSGRDIRKGQDRAFSFLVSLLSVPSPRPPLLT